MKSIAEALFQFPTCTVTAIFESRIGSKVSQTSEALFMWNLQDCIPSVTDLWILLALWKNCNGNILINWPGLVYMASGRWHRHFLNHVQIGLDCITVFHASGIVIEFTWVTCGMAWALHSAWGEPHGIEGRELFPSLWVPGNVFPTSQRTISTGIPLLLSRNNAALATSWSVSRWCNLTQLTGRATLSVYYGWLQHVWRKKQKRNTCKLRTEQNTTNQCKNIKQNRTVLAQRKCNTTKQV